MTHTAGYSPATGLRLSELYLVHCGWEICESLHSYGPAVRDHILIHYVAGGCGTFHKDGHSFPLATGDAFAIFPGETTTYIADQHNPWAYYWVGFSGTAAPALLHSAGISPGNPVFHLGQPSDAVAACVQDIYTETALSGGGNLRALGHLLRFLSFLADGTPPSGNSSSPPPRSEYIAAAVRIVQERHASGLTVQDLARLIGIDRTHLFRAFKDCLGVGPREYILECRVEHACRLLRETRMPLREIADATGFSSPTHFGAAFRRLRGVAPREYRAVHA